MILNSQFSFIVYLYILNFFFVNICAFFVVLKIHYHPIYQHINRVFHLCGQNFSRLMDTESMEVDSFSKIKISSTKKEGQVIQCLMLEFEDSQSWNYRLLGTCLCFLEHREITAVWIWNAP